MLKKISIVFLVFVVAAISIAAQKKPVTKVNTVVAIDKYVKTLNNIEKKSKEPDIVAADTSDADSDKPVWKKFVSVKALEKAREEKETYTIAYNWKSNGKIVVSNFTYFSPSGDWSQYVYNYFREDGSLARVDSELRTFMDDCVISQKYYFNSKGTRIKKTLAYFDLKTDKPKKRCLGADALKFDFFRSVGKLPFKDR